MSMSSVPSSTPLRSTRSFAANFGTGTTAAGGGTTTAGGTAVSAGVVVVVVVVVVGVVTGTGSSAIDAAATHAENSDVSPVVSSVAVAVIWRPALVGSTTPANVVGPDP